MSTEPVLRWEHEDAQNDLKVVAVYEDLGIGPMVVFDGAGFLDSVQLGSYIESLQAAKLKLELLREAREAQDDPLIGGVPKSVRAARHDARVADWDGPED